jgi:hypothetical protein
MDSQEIDRLARKRAGAKMGFIVHATVYVLVNLMLAAMAFSMGRNWAVFPAVGWGFGLAMHGIVVFMVTGNAGLHDRLVERERMKLQGDPW